MIRVVKQIGWLATTMLVILSVAACTDEVNVNTVSTTTVSTPASSSSSVEAVAMDIYKSETCGCCEKWVTHVDSLGFETTVHHPDDLNKVKADKGIAPRYQSCHTAITKDGYVFEGHVPAHLIKRFLANPPASAIGLAVPGMPVGSPGMEVGDRFDPYDVLLLKSDGSSEVYAHMANAES
jgi:hypothetical protein